MNWARSACQVLGYAFFPVFEWLCIASFLVAVAGTGHQLYVFARDGVLVERDLFWLFSPKHCWRAGIDFTYLEAMDACRIESIHFTDWLGVNAVLNYLFDVQIWVVFLASLFAFFWALCAKYDN